MGTLGPMKAFLSLLALLFLPLMACQAPGQRLAKLADEQRREAQTEVKKASDALSRNERLNDRAGRVREILESQGAELTPQDEFHAALVLVESDRAEDLDAAMLIALKAAEGGENRAFRVAAEAQDRLLVKRGQAQRYGTQFAWEAVNKMWRLYPIDPRTTDAERKAMGVPSLAELKQQEAQLNEKNRRPQNKRN